MNDIKWIDQKILALEADLTEAMKSKSADHIISDMAAGCWIYGAGNYGRQIAAILVDRNLPCLGFIDQRGSQIAENDGLPVIRPEEFTKTLSAGKICLICVFNPNAWAPDILPWAKEQGFEKLFWGADLPEAFGAAADSFWLTARRDVSINIDLLRNAACLLSDQQSRDIFFSLLNFRLHANPLLHPPIDRHDQYLPHNLPGFVKTITFVDGGAYDGDTYRFLKNSGVDINHWIAFEPDLNNFDKLSKNAQATDAKSTLFPCGLSDHAHLVTFESGMGTGSRISGSNPNGANITAISCVALDDVIQNQKIDFIKCDIEGAESAALNGMAKTLSQSRPRLAVSLYHKPCDLWELVNQTAGLLPESDFYIRQHAGNSFETVLYAIPR
jgi:FkbM family methyltransferase